MYLYPDNYSFKLILRNSICSISSQTYDIPFTIKYPSWILEQNWDDVVAVLNKNYNGGFEFKQYKWFINQEEVGTSVGSNLYYPGLKEGDVVYAELTRLKDEASIETCPIYIQQMKGNKTDYPVLVFPKAVQSGGTINIKAKPNSKYAMYSLTGIEILSGKIGISGEETVKMSMQGTFLLSIITNEGIDSEMIHCY